jgi:hypothetical protein
MKINFMKLFNIHNISDVRQIEIHTAELPVPGWNFYCKAEKYKSLGSDQIPAELYQAGGETLVSVIHKLITSIWIKEELPDH